MGRPMGRPTGLQNVYVLPSFLPPSLLDQLNKYGLALDWCAVYLLYEGGCNSSGLVEVGGSCTRRRYTS